MQAQGGEVACHGFWLGMNRTEYQSTGKSGQIEIMGLT